MKSKLPNTNEIHKKSQPKNDEGKHKVAEQSTATEPINMEEPVIKETPTVMETEEAETTKRKSMLLMRHKKGYLTHLL